MMKRFWLKIVGCVVVVLLAVIAVYVFWPAQRPDDDDKTRSVQKIVPIYTGISIKQ